MAIKTSTEDIIHICSEKNVTYISHTSRPTGSMQKKKVFVQFMCEKHQKYGYQEKLLSDFKRYNQIYSYCSHRMLHITFREEMYQINPDIEILSDYVNWNTPIKCRCKIDGYEWDASASSLLYGSGCKICGHKKRWDSRGRKTTADIINEMKLINSDIEIIGEYYGSHKMIQCKCKLDNTVWESYACNLLNGSAGCPTCAAKSIKDNLKLSDEEFILRVKESNPNIQILGKYQNAHTPVNFKCLIHNFEFSSLPTIFLYKGGKGCPRCVQSSGERKMIDILERNGIVVDYQHTFLDCKHINCLRFDAYDSVNRIAYEYQGEQHYYPVDFAGKGIEWANEQFELNKKRDQIKKQYCKENHIRLIEVPYWEFENMEEFLFSQL